MEPGPLEPGHQDPGLLSKFKSGTWDTSDLKSEIIGTFSKFKCGTPGVVLNRARLGHSLHDPRPNPNFHFRNTVLNFHYIFLQCF